MGLVEQRQLIAQLTPPLDPTMAEQLISEYVSMEHRYFQRDWEPAELDGGHFCEALARILYHQDSGKLDPRRGVGDCLQFIEDHNGAHAAEHQMVRQDAQHLARMIRAIYNFRNNRGVAHISPTYKANEMDARVVMDTCRWCLNEALRIFWNGSREAVAKAVRELLQFDVPVVGVFEDVILVQRIDLTVDEEILVLLHYAGEQGFTRLELNRHVRRDSRRISEAIHRLVEVRQIVELSNRRYCLTGPGHKRVREQLAEKLVL